MTSGRARAAMVVWVLTGLCSACASSASETTKPADTESNEAVQTDKEAGPSEAIKQRFEAWRAVPGAQRDVAELEAMAAAALALAECEGVGSAVLFSFGGLGSGCGLTNTCGSPDRREVEFRTDEGSLRLVLADAYFEIADDRDACVGFMRVKLADGPDGACEMLLTTTAGEKGSREAAITSASVQATEQCEASPASLRGEYQLDEAGKSASSIKLRGLPEDEYMGTWCLLDGMKVHLEGTFVQSNPPADGVDPGVESFEVEPTDFNVSGEIFGDKRSAKCAMHADQP